MTPRRRITLSLAAPTLLILSACNIGPQYGAGPPFIERRSVADVPSVTFTAPGELVISVGPPALTVTAGDNLVGRVATEVRDGVLLIDLVGPVVGDIQDIQFDLSLPAVEEIRVEGSGHVELDPVQTDELTLTVEGDCGLTGHDIDVDELTVVAGGSAVVDLAGSATHQIVTLDDAGEYRAAALATDDADVVVSDDASARILVEDALHATVAGAGTISHSGGAEVTALASAAGQISPY